MTGSFAFEWWDFTGNLMHEYHVDFLSSCFLNYVIWDKKLVFICYHSMLCIVISKTHTIIIGTGCNWGFRTWVKGELVRVCSCQESCGGLQLCLKAGVTIVIWWKEMKYWLCLAIRIEWHWVQRTRERYKGGSPFILSFLTDLAENGTELGCYTSFNDAEVVRNITANTVHCLVTMSRLYFHVCWSSLFARRSANWWCTAVDMPLMRWLSRDLLLLWLVALILWLSWWMLGCWNCLALQDG